MRGISRICLIGALCAVTGAWADTKQASLDPWYLGKEAINTRTLKPGPERIIVAVIDTEVSTTHPLLYGKLLPSQKMALDERVNTSYQRGWCATGAPKERAKETHGTDVASLIAGGDGKTRFGVNEKAMILPISIVRNCLADQESLVKALLWASGASVDGLPSNEYPARVINLSMSGITDICSENLAQVTQELQRAGVFIVASAGNTYGAKIRAPASCPGVISVGSLTSSNHVANHSAVDPRITLYAPGGGHSLEAPVYTFEQELRSSDSVNNASDLAWGGQSIQGTSYAAAITSGFISLWLSKNPNWRPEDFLSALELSGRSLPHTYKCVDCQPKGLDGVALMNSKLATHDLR